MKQGIYEKDILEETIVMKGSTKMSNRSQVDELWMNSKLKRIVQN